MKKLIIGCLLLGSTLFAGGFDTPVEAFKFWYSVVKTTTTTNITVKDMAAAKKLQPHMSSGDIQHARASISGYITIDKEFNRSGKRAREFGYKQPRDARIGKGIVLISYWDYAVQKEKRRYGHVFFKPKKVGSKIKWFIN